MFGGGGSRKSRSMRNGLERGPVTLSTPCECDRRPGGDGEGRQRMRDQSSSEAASRSGRSLRIHSTFLRAVAAGVMMLLSACTGGREPRYADIAAKVPPVVADRARLYFYRDYEPYESLGRPYIYLNSQRNGISEPGGVFYRDIPEGTYLVLVDSY